MEKTTVSEYPCGSAFPAGKAEDPNDYERGMTLRDYFAAKAIQVIMNWDNQEEIPTETLCKDAYEWADEMLKAREGK